MRFSLAHKSWYHYIFIAGSLLFLVVISLVIKIIDWITDTRTTLLPLELVIAVIGFFGGLTHFLYSQHYQNTDFFYGLFKDFNMRYDRLNKDLNEIQVRNREVPFSKDEEHTLYDYFNLCAEEYLFYKAGYIDKVVWSAWCRGMAEYASDPEIEKLWRKELATDSYYGFTLDVIHSR